MQSCVEKEAGEVADVALSNAGTHPRAMMIMHFNAEAADATVVRTWWSKYLACIAIRKCLVIRLHALL